MRVCVCACVILTPCELRPYNYKEEETEEGEEKLLTRPRSSIDIQFLLRVNKSLSHINFLLLLSAFACGLEHQTQSPS